MASSIAPGTFVLHSTAVPDLPAGPYTVHTEQRFDAPGAATETRDTYIEVTAPRYVLPPDQVLSTFPPNKSQGAFSSRLAQIVLKRRTLPWERELDGRLAAGDMPSGIPWLALVLLADAECDFKSAQPIAECVTPGVVLEGRNDAAVADRITVTQTVVDQVFPAKEELPLLAHVREVDLSDTELALGDDDGWLAVVLANRVPQAGVQYRACLISLEGQYEVLPEGVAVAPEPAVAFKTPFVYPAAVGQATTGRRAASAVKSTSVADAWSSKSLTVQKQISRSTKPSALAGNSPFAIPGALHVADMQVLHPSEPLYTFPVLANWQFTCNEDPDFAGLMRGLDVGMLDTIPLDAPVAAGDKPPAPKRAPPDVTYTGHVDLSYVDRNGDAGSAWYRGPLVPHPGGRDEPAGGVLPLLHASDQARRIGPDGRDNLSLAAAFEIGRLLALAEPSVVAAFLNWRKEGFETARRTALVATDAQLSLVAVRDTMAGFAARVGQRVLVDLGANDAARFGAVRPAVDPGCPIAGLDDADVVKLIASGFGVPVAMVRELIEPAVQRTGAIDVPVATRPTDLAEIAAGGAAELSHLTNAARRTATDIAQTAISGGAAGAADALDGLLDTAGGGRR